MPARTVRQHLAHMGAALGYSLQGLRAAARHETAFRQEIFALLLLPALAYFYGVPPAKLPFIALGWVLVMAFELMNMAVESVCNLVSPDFHPLVKIAKDAGSAAVFLVIIVNVLYLLYLFYVY